MGTRHKLMRPFVQQSLLAIPLSFDFLQLALQESWIAFQYLVRLGEHQLHQADRMAMVLVFAAQEEM